MTQQTDFITCKQCGNTDPLTSKFKCSKCGAKDWGHQRPSKSGKRAWVGELIVLAVLLGGFFTYNAIKENRKRQPDNHSQESLIDKRMEYAIQQQEKNDPGVSFGKEDGWKEIYEIANPITGVAESDMSNYDKLLVSDEFQYSNESSRLRIKARGFDFPLVVKLSRKNNSGGFEEIKRYSVSQESSAAYDFGALDGIYHIEVSYNTVQTAFRLVWEKEEK